MSRLSQSLELSPARRSLLLAVLVLGYLWFTLINHLRIEWLVNPQYNYGWAVPFLCVYLLWRRVSGENQKLGKQPAEVRGQTTGAVRQGDAVYARSLIFPPSAFYFLLSVLAFLWLPVRLVQEANPEWRLVSWGLALIVIGLTLLVAYFGFRISDFGFPVLFFLVAVPWPTVFEAPIIQNLTRLNAAGAVEVLTWLGIPALRQGNVIEISTGLVGIEDACSGIRSLQACLMIGLFLGAYYRLRYASRLGLVLAGMGMAMLLNLARTVLLVAVASRQGMEAIAAWHDPAGVSILVGCFLSVWWLAARRARAGGRKGGGQKTEISDDGNTPKSEIANRISEPSSALRPRPLALCASLLIWFGIVEISVEAWYRSHERGLAERATWRVELPVNTPGFQELPFSETTVRFLRFDEGLNAVWRDGAGDRCQAIFLRWDPGRIAVHLARSHTPEVCLSSAGRQLAGAPEVRMITVEGLVLPFDAYHAPEENLWVYYCLWEDRVPDEDSRTQSLTYQSRLKPVLAGRRNLGQRSLEFAFWSNQPAAEVHARAEQHLQSLIQLRKTGL